MKKKKKRFLSIGQRILHKTTKKKSQKTQWGLPLKRDPSQEP